MPHLRGSVENRTHYNRDLHLFSLMPHLRGSIPHLRGFLNCILVPILGHCSIPHLRGSIFKRLNTSLNRLLELYPSASPRALFNTSLKRFIILLKRHDAVNYIILG